MGGAGLMDEWAEIRGEKRERRKEREDRGEMEGGRGGQGRGRGGKGHWAAIKVREKLIQQKAIVQPLKEYILENSHWSKLEI